MLICINKSWSFCKDSRYSVDFDLSLIQCLDYIVKFCPNKILQYWSLKEYMSSTLPYVSMLHSVLKFLLGSVWKKNTWVKHHIYLRGIFLFGATQAIPWLIQNRKIPIHIPIITCDGYCNIELNPESRCSTRINIVFHKITTPHPKNKNMFINL